MPLSDTIPTRSLSLHFGEALAFAEDLHAYAKRKDRATPYIAHLLAVCGTVLEVGGSEEESIAALLFDATANNGSATLARIRDRFGDRIAGVIYTLSGRAVQGNPTAPWVERKRTYVRHLRNCNDESVYLVSAADRLHFVRCVMHAHRTSGESVWLRFNSGKPGFVWYHEELVEMYRTEPLDPRRASLVEELAETVDRIKKFNPVHVPMRSITGRAETGEAAAF